jgi:hypothetical protein
MPDLHEDFVAEIRKEREAVISRIDRYLALVDKYSAKEEPVVPKESASGRYNVQ